MKAERRHELRENDLVHYLQVTRDYIRDHSGRIGMVCVVILAVVAAVSLGIRSRAAAHEDIYRRKDRLTFENVETGRESLESLAGLIEDSTDDSFALKGLLEQGRQALRLSQEVPFPPDPELNQLARSAFEEMRRRFADNPLAVGVALNSLATVEENEFVYDEDPSHKERAREYLTAIVDNPMLNGMPFQRIALDRLEALDETFTAVILEAPSLTPEELEELEAEIAKARAEESAKPEVESADDVESEGNVDLATEGVDEAGRDDDDPDPETDDESNGEP